MEIEEDQEGLRRERMKRSMAATTSYDRTSLSTEFNVDEYAVAEILLDFSTRVVVLELEPNPPISLKWFAKRRRSALDPNPHDHDRLLLTSPPPSRAAAPSSIRGRDEEEGAAEMERARVKAESSPDTPLAFPPSETDERSKPSQGMISKKRKIVHLLETANELTERRQVLRREIENVRCHYKKLKAYNTLLKTVRMKLQLGLDKEKNAPNLVIRKSLGQTTTVNKKRGPSVTLMPANQKPLIVDQTAHGSPRPEENFQYPVYPLLSSGSGLGMINHHVGPLATPALGLDFSQPSDLNRRSTMERAEATEARKRRMVKVKEMKNSLATTKFKPPGSR